MVAAFMTARLFARSSKGQSSVPVRDDRRCVSTVESFSRKLSASNLRA